MASSVIGIFIICEKTTVYMPSTGLSTAVVSSSREVAFRKQKFDVATLWATNGSFWYSVGTSDGTRDPHFSTCRGFMF